MMRPTSIVPCCIIVLCLAQGGCSTSPPMQRPPLQVLTLPNREAQATILDDLAVVHDAAIRLVRDELGYEIIRAHLDERTRTARIDAAKPDGSSIRVESKANRDFETTLVQVFAVDPESTTGNPQRAGEILDRIDGMLWGPGQ